MKRIQFDERNYVVTEVMGSEREEIKKIIIEFFQALARHEDDGSGFPLWGESRAKLMQVVYVLTKWQALRDDHGVPLTMKAAARLLCEKVHCEVPANIYQPSSRKRRLHRRSVVDYYARLWREARVGPQSSLLWYLPIQWPKIKSYRGVFK